MKNIRVKNKLLISAIILCVIVPIVVLLMFLLSRCDFNALLRNKMLNYYADNSNYVKLQGIIISVEEDEQESDNIKIQILTEGHDFPLNTDGNCVFEIAGDGHQNYGLSAGDEIVFVSAPMHFYNGHDLPIVALEKDSKELLSFADGKNTYLDWIIKAFD